MRKYETYCKVNGKFRFMGWYPMNNEEFCINTKQRKDRQGNNWIYKTYKWINEKIEEYKYGSYIEE